MTATFMTNKTTINSNQPLCCESCIAQSQVCLYIFVQYNQLYEYVGSAKCLTCIYTIKSFAIGRRKKYLFVWGKEIIHLA